MNDKAFYTRQKCNYSSSKLGVESGDLLEYFDFKRVLLDFFIPMIPTILERMISPMTPRVILGLTSWTKEIIFNPKIKSKVKMTNNSAQMEKKKKKD